MSYSKHRKSRYINYGRDGIRIADKPSERMFGFLFDDTLVDKMVGETEEKLKEGATAKNGSKTK
jgi:hypothetical protein